MRGQLQAAMAFVTINGVIPIRRTPLLLFNTLAAPLSFLFFISVTSQGERIGYGVAGGLVLTTLAIGTSLQADIMHFRLDLKIQDMVVASPVRAQTYLLGMALSELVYASPGILVFIIVGLAGGWMGPLGLLPIVAVLFLVWSLGSSLGFFLATYLRDIRETFALSPLLSLTLSVLPPVYYPLESIPQGFRWLALLAPTTHAARLIQASLGLSPLAATDWAVSFAALAAFTLGFISLARFKAQWRET